MQSHSNDFGIGKSIEEWPLRLEIGSGFFFTRLTSLKSCILVYKADRGWSLMIKAIIFDLDDTLLWDKKSVETGVSKKHVNTRLKYMILIQLNLKKRSDWKQESFMKHMIHMNLRR